MVWRTHVLQMSVFIMPARGLMSKQQLYGFASTGSPTVSFYNASAGSYVQAIVSNMVWRTPLLQMTIFIMPVRGLMAKQ